MSAPRWYRARGEQVLGPFELAELRRLAAAGRLGRADPLCPEGGTEWVPAAAVPGLFPSPPPLPTPPPAPPPPPDAGGTRSRRPWRETASRGGAVGVWSGVIGVALLALYVRLGADHPGDSTDGNVWGAWLCVGFSVAWLGKVVGFALGAVIGRAVRKADVARAVTTTATAAFFLVCLGMAAVHLSNRWKEQRREARAAAATPLHRGRTVREWVAVYQQREPDTWLDATEALQALGTEECVAAYARELDTGDSGIMQLDAIHGLELLAARGVRATRAALPALRRIASRAPRPGSAPPPPKGESHAAAAVAVRAIEALE